MVIKLAVVSMSPVEPAFRLRVDVCVVRPWSRDSRNVDGRQRRLVFWHWDGSYFGCVDIGGRVVGMSWV